MRQIKLANNKGTTLVDDEDFERFGEFAHLNFGGD